ncbi:MAG: prepilin-type N-terminal cleavage/methylation domain-containing protein [Planctomycetes bacterium]|nr:prepilin-type N-terminal cleavage/methylation domain-containing protein [Planctomycetota bacterium]
MGRNLIPLRESWETTRSAARCPGRHGRAFTLIELLVVIAIMALLMGILLPVLGRVRKQAQKVACLSNLRQMGVALQAYLPDAEYRLPPSSCHTRDPNDHWLRILTRYTREQLLFRCPSDTGKQFVNWDRPLEEQKEARYSSFAVNALLDPIHFRYGGRSNRYNNVNNIRRPMACIWLSEAPDTDSFRLADHIHPELWEGSPEYAKRFIAWDRHRGTAHYLFADGHVEGLKFEQTYDWPGTCNWYPETAPKWPESP